MKKVTSVGESFDLLIKIDPTTNEPIDHPMSVWNFKQVYPHINLNNIPDNWAFFRRKEIPEHILTKTPETVLKLPESKYVWNDGVLEDSWQLRDMTEEEVTSHIQAYDRDYQTLMLDINNVLCTLKYWAKYNIENCENKDAWVNWDESIPREILPPPQVLRK